MGYMQLSLGVAKHTKTPAQVLGYVASSALTLPKHKPLVAAADHQNSSNHGMSTALLAYTKALAGRSACTRIPIQLAFGKQTQRTPGLLQIKPAFCTARCSK
jgi:hypothetical protein